MHYDPLNKNVSLTKIQHIIDRVHERYPLISKSETTIIIKAFFDVLRFRLVNFDSIAIANMFSKMHLYYYNKNVKNKLTRIVQVKLRTSPKMKE